MVRSPVYLGEKIKLSLMKERLSIFSLYSGLCYFVEDLLKTHPRMRKYFGEEEIKKAQERLNRVG